MAAHGSHRVVDAAVPGKSIPAVIGLWAAIANGKPVSAVEQPNATVAGRLGIGTTFILTGVRTDVLATLGETFEGGTIKPRIGDVRPLKQARTAHGMLAGTHARQPDGITLRS